MYTHGPPTYIHMGRSPQPHVYRISVQRSPSIHMDGHPVDHPTGMCMESTVSIHMTGPPVDRDLPVGRSCVYIRSIPYTYRMCDLPDGPPRVFAHVTHVYRRSFREHQFYTHTVGVIYPCVYTWTIPYTYRLGDLPVSPPCV